jgi:parallel beta-helix repeat protein
MTTRLIGRRRLFIAALLSILLLSSFASSAITNTEITDAIDEFFFRVEQLEFAQYLARTAVLSGQPEDQATHCQEIINILSKPPVGALDALFASPIGLIDWANHAADDPKLLLVVRPSTQTTFLYSHTLVLGYLELALAECQQALESSKTFSARELHLKKAYAFLSTALGTPDTTFSVNGLKAAEDVLPRQVVFLSPGDSIQKAVDGLPDGGVIFLEAGEYRDQYTIVSKSIWISQSPNTSMQVRLVGRSGLPIFLLRGSAADIELSDLTIAEGYTGVRLEESASCWISDCIIIDNDFAGIEATANSAMTLVGARIRGNYLYGLLASDTARVALVDCDISLNVYINTRYLGAGIAASGNVTINAQDCSMIGNAGYGIILSGDATLSADNLYLIYSRRSGIHLQQASQASLTTCYIGINGYSDISIYSLECYAEHNEDWSPERTFTGTLEGFDNSTELYHGDIRTCLGSYALPEDFFVLPADE